MSTSQDQSTIVLQGYHDSPHIKKYADKITRIYNEIFNTKHSSVEFIAPTALPSYWILLVESGRILGIACSWSTSESLTCHAIGVTKYWRQRHIGSILMKHLVQYAAGRRIYVNVPSDNIAALKFFRKFSAETIVSDSTELMSIDTQNYIFPWHQ